MWLHKRYIKRRLKLGEIKRKGRVDSLKILSLESLFKSPIRFYEKDN